jgi:hypothetical protein
VQPDLYHLLQVVAGLLVLAWCVQLLRRRVPVQGYVLGVISIWSCWQLLFGPGTERLTYGLLAPAVSWAVLESFSRGRHRSLPLCAWLLTGPLSTGEVEKLLLLILPLAKIMMPLGVVLLTAWVVVNQSRLVRLDDRGEPPGRRPHSNREGGPQQFPVPRGRTEPAGARGSVAQIGVA